MNIGDNAKEQLRSIIDRIEEREQEKANVAAEIKDIYTEAKSSGFDVKALRTIVRMRKQDKEKREEQEAVLTTYLQALGMI